MGNLSPDDLRKIIEAPENTNKMPSSVKPLLRLPSDSETRQDLCFDEETKLLVCSKTIYDQHVYAKGEEAIHQRMIREWTVRTAGIPGICPGIKRGFPKGEPSWMLCGSDACGPLSLFSSELIRQMHPYSWDYTNILIVIHRLFATVSQIFYKDFVHRCITAESIVMDENMIPHFGDMYFTKHLTGNNTCPGSFYYTAPEILRAVITHNEDTGSLQLLTDRFDTKHSDKADVYSVGMVIYDLMMGHFPADAKDMPRNEEAITARERDRLMNAMLVASPGKRHTVSDEADELAMRGSKCFKTGSSFNFDIDFRERVSEWIKKCLSDHRPSPAEICDEVVYQVDIWIKKQAQCEPPGQYFINEEKWKTYREFTVKELTQPEERKFGTLDQLKKGGESGAFYPLLVRTLLWLEGFIPYDDSAVRRLTTIVKQLSPEFVQKHPTLPTLLDSLHASLTKARGKDGVWRECVSLMHAVEGAQKLDS